MDSTATAEVGSDLSISLSFRDQKQIESFIRKTKLLKVIEDAAEKYVTNFHKTKAPEEALAAIVVTLPFIYTELLGRFADLIHLAIEEPVQFLENTKYTVYGIVRDLVKNRNALTDLKSNIDIDQVHVQLRFIGLPTQKELIFDPSVHSYRTGLSTIDGILRAHTEPENFVIRAVWYCATGCTCNKIVTESLEAPTCSSCSKQMSEYSKLRVSQKLYLLRIQLSKSVRTPRIYDKIFEPITITRSIVTSHLETVILLLATTITSAVHKSS